MPQIRISLEHCKGCGLCAAFCPRGVLEMSAELGPRGVNPAAITDPSKCAGCLNCAVICPDAAVEIENGPKQPSRSAQ